MSTFGSFIMDKCMDFSIRIVNLYKHLKSTKKETVLSKQLLRSGTSIGANMAEAQNSISQAEFKAKTSIALKEATESQYWIELLFRTNYLESTEYSSIKNDCDEIVALLTSTLKKLG